MDLLLLHIILLVWLSMVAARRWTDHPADLLLAAAALAWANLLLTALALSPFHQLGRPGAFLAVSTGFGCVGVLLAYLFPAPPRSSPTTASAHPWLLWTAALTLVPLGVASAIAATAYLPDSPAVYAYELPRALLQVAHGSIFPLPVADARQVLLPFNGGLLHTWLLVFGTPLPALGAVNLIGWVLAGLAVNRLARAAGWSANAALVASWCALTATPVLAHAATTDNGLPAATALVAGLAFALTWRNENRPVLAALGGLCLGLAAGSSPGVGLVVAATLAAGLAAGYVPPDRPGRRRAAFGLILGLLPFSLNLALATDVRLASLISPVQATSANIPLLRADLLVPLWQNPGIFKGPSEDSVGLGLPGLACLLAAALILGRWRSSQRLTALLAACAFGWLALILVTGRWFNAGSSELILVILLATPALAALVDRWHSAPRVALGVGVLIAAGGLWSDKLYLWHNARRPLGPLLYPDLALARPSLLPPQLENRLARMDQINFISEGEDPLLLALMSQRARQRFETSATFDDAAYNVFSRQHLGRNRPLGELAEGPAYVLVPFAGKPTAGVEFLGSASQGSLRRDYLGEDGVPNRIAPARENQALLVTVAATDGKAEPSLDLELQGLDPRDRAGLEVWAESPEGGGRLLTQFTANGRLTVPRPPSLARLRLRIVAQNDGHELGVATLGSTRDLDVEAAVAADPRLCYSEELVSLHTAPTVRSSEGLTIAEGPFPAWNLPVIRWSRAETVTLRVPAPAGAARLRLNYSVRPQLRTQAILVIVANGKVVQRLEFDDPLSWRDGSVEFDARSGENTVELRDAPLPPEPDWVRYLDRYPDVRHSVEVNRMSAKEGALLHYRVAGQPEGREMHFLLPPRPAPDAFRFMFRRLRVEGFRP
ncbi:MAG: hypothetical protein KF897_11445 [Opitutaceae bacterium]|nr:hypothetical protein [Opitutaceae bacterium]